MSTMYADVERVFDEETGFRGERIKREQFGATTDTGKLVIRLPDGSYRFIADYNDANIREQIANKQERLTQGENITIDENNVISAKDTVYEHPTFEVHDVGLYKIGVTGEGHVDEAVEVTKEDITALGIPGENTVYDDTEIRELIEAEARTRHDGDVILANDFLMLEEVTRTTDAALSARIDKVENLGHYVGAFDTLAQLPTTTAAFPQGITRNDFATIRADETKGGAITRYVVSSIDNGVITWTFDLIINTDATGKADKVAGATEGNLAALDANGNLMDSGGSLTAINSMLQALTNGKADITALNDYVLKAQDKGVAAVNFNAITETGIYSVMGSASLSNHPPTTSYVDRWNLFVVAGGSGGILQVANYYSSDDGDRVRYRTRNASGTWTGWKEWGVTVSSADLTEQAATPGQGQRNGEAETFARSDHYHPLPEAPTLGSIGAAPASHVHNTSDITAGVLPFVRGGLGTATNPAINTVFAGARNGTPAEPTFRGLQADDIPEIPMSKVAGLDETLSNIELTPGEQGQRGLSVVGMRLDENGNLYYSIEREI